MLKGKKVELVPMDKRYVNFFLKWLNDSEVTQYIVPYLPMTKEAEEKWVGEMSLSSNDAIFIILAIDGKKKIPIGSCGIHRIDWKNRDAEAGIVIGNKKYWSHGYGSEAASLMVGYAFSQLNLNRITAGAYEFNERSIRMQKKIGFQAEGTARSAIYKNGKYWNKVMLGILKEEWEAKKQ